MKKKQLIAEVAKKTDYSQAVVANVIDSMTQSIISELQNDGTVTLTGFGSFATSHRGERTGRNPKTGESIQVKPSRSARFRPGKTIKDALR